MNEEVSDSAAGGRNWRTIVVMLVRSVLAFLTILLLTGCVRLPMFSEGTSGVDHLRRDNPDFACKEVLQQLESARRMVAQIHNFTWTEFAAIGVVLPPPGVCATGTTYLAEKGSVPSGLGWMPLTEKLSFHATANNFAIVCDNCLSLAGKVCSSSKRLSPDEKQEHWCQLESALTGAMYLVSAHKDIIVHQVVPETESQFGRSSDGVRKKYGDKFKARCEQYLALLDGLLYHLESAKKAASIMSGEQNEVYR